MDRPPRHPRWLPRQGPTRLELHEGLALADHRHCSLVSVREPLCRLALSQQAYVLPRRLPRLLRDRAKLRQALAGLIVVERHIASKEHFWMSLEAQVCKRG